MRPLHDYFTQGEDAWFDGNSEASNPYLPETLAWQEWHRGNMFAETHHNSDFDQDREAGRLMYFEEAVSHSRWMLAQLKLDLPTVDEAAAAIGVPAEKWPSNCYGISTLILDSGILDDFQDKHGKLFLTFGKYTGPVASNSIFAGKPIIQHGWLESPNGFVVDPTRWVFEPEFTDIWAGVISDYDMGAARLNLRMRPHVPDADEKMIRILVNDTDILRIIDQLLEGKAEAQNTGQVSMTQLHWLANLPLEKLGDQAERVYSALKTSDAAGLIPQDNRKWIEDYASWKEDQAYKVQQSTP